MHATSWSQIRGQNMELVYHFPKCSSAKLKSFLVKLIYYKKINFKRTKLMTTKVYQKVQTSYILL